MTTDDAERRIQELEETIRQHETAMRRDKAEIENYRWRLDALRDSFVKVLEDVV
jgi:molecular chaperone GrpE (heat shock protein)